MLPSLLGNIFHDQGQYEEALQAWREATQREPDCVTTHTNMGLLLGKMGRHTEAVSELEISMTIKPESPRVRYSLAVALLADGRQEDAKREWEWVATQEDPVAESARKQLDQLGKTA